MSTTISRQALPTRRLSIIPNPSRSRQNSLSASFTGLTAGVVADASDTKNTEITIHVEGEDKAMIRPNKIMRGKQIQNSKFHTFLDIKLILGIVKVKTKKTIYSSQLRIKVCHLILM
jgi:hypothetical protein